MKRLILIFVALFLLVPLIGLLVGWLESPRLEQVAYKALESIAQLKTRQIESWLDERTGDGNALVRSRISSDWCWSLSMKTRMRPEHRCASD